MRGAIHPLPNTPSWRGVHIKHFMMINLREVKILPVVLSTSGLTPKHTVNVKGKVITVLSFLLTEHHAMKAYWGVEV
jgi:hypothetical protein